MKKRKKEKNTQKRGKKIKDHSLLVILVQLTVAQARSNIFAYEEVPNAIYNNRMISHAIKRHGELPSF